VSTSELWRLAVGVAVGRKQDLISQLVQDEDLCYLRCEPDAVWRHPQSPQLSVRNQFPSTSVTVAVTIFRKKNVYSPTKEKLPKNYLMKSY